MTEILTTLAELAAVNPSAAAAWEEPELEGKITTIWILGDDDSLRSVSTEVDSQDRLIGRMEENWLPNESRWDLKKFWNFK